MTSQGIAVGWRPGNPLARAVRCSRCRSSNRNRAGGQSQSQPGDDRLQGARAYRRNEGGQAQLRQRPVGEEVVDGLLDGAWQGRQDTGLIEFCGAPGRRPGGIRPTRFHGSESALGGCQGSTLCLSVHGYGKLATPSINRHPSSSVDHCSRNCSSSVEPFRASREASPPLMARATSSKYPAPTSRWCLTPE